MRSILDHEDGVTRARAAARFLAVGDELPARPDLERPAWGAAVRRVRWAAILEARYET